MSSLRMLSRTGAPILALAVVLAALPYAPDAEAHGGRRAGVFFGGVVLGSVFAPRYVYSAPYYYPPPVYYAPYPPAITYVQPPVVIQQVAPTAPTAPLAPTQPAVQLPAPSSVAAAAQTMSIEDRLRRLRSMCEQGLFTEAECHHRREQILQEM